jgi:hypothetical protein
MGGLDIINRAKYLIVELQDTQYNKGAPLANTTISFLENNGWELIAPKFCDNGPDADYCFKNMRYDSNINIAIFNSFSFHYEMFGYIIDYCKRNKHNLTIFTNTDNSLGWLEFYKIYFKEVIINYKTIDTFENEKNNFDIIFVTTDDDYNFKTEWINEKCISINHHYTIRRLEYSHNLGTRPFIENMRYWALPCYPLLNNLEKQNGGESDINIAIIGGLNNELNYDIINRLESSGQIILHICGRNYNKINIYKIKSNIIVNVYMNMKTIEMLNLLKKTDFILTDTSNNLKNINGQVMSGAVPLAFSTLTPLIISKTNNQIYNFKNIIEFDLCSEDMIIIEKGKINIGLLVEERDILVSMLDNYIDNIFKFPILKLNSKIKSIKIPKRIIQTWKHKDLNPEFQKIVDVWKTNNPDYEYILFDDNECKEFIKDNFDREILNTYNYIVPGAYKADLFRYCYLYINGGVYIDIDTLCIGKLDDFLLPNVEFIAPIDLNSNPNEGYHNIFNSFICSIPKHSILLECINKIVYNVKNDIIPLSKLDFSGPGVLGRCVNKFLGNIETKSFIDTEGIKNNIYLLKFEKKTEYVKDNVSGNILFQNKNGNQNIINLYKQECEKLSNYVCWVKSNNIICKEKNKNLAIMCYGQFRSYKKNLVQNINMLKPITQNYNVHLFILSDKLENGNFSKENEEEIKNIFLSYGFKIHIFEYMENLNYFNDEDKYVDFFFNNVKFFYNNFNNNLGIGNNFVPRLLYRKFILNKLKNDYIINNNIDINLNLYCRFFDTKITNNISFEKIEEEISFLNYNHNYIFGSSDTFFMGSQNSIDFLFDIVKGNLYHNEIWNNKQFDEFVASMDLCLCQTRATYSPEIQYIAHIYFSSSFKYKNIRVDYNNINSELNKMALYNVKHDPERFITYNKPKDTE